MAMEATESAMLLNLQISTGALHILTGASTKIMQAETCQIVLEFITFMATKIDTTITEGILKNKCNMSLDFKKMIALITDTVLSNRPGGAPIGAKIPDWMS